MARYLCSYCREVVEAAPTRFAFCGECGSPLTTEDIVPVQLVGGPSSPSDQQAIPEPTGST